MSLQASGKRSFELVPEGEYEFIVEEVKRTKSTKGNLLFKVRLYVEIEGKEFRVFENITFTEKCIPIITNYVRSVGVEVSEGEELQEEWIEESVGKSGRAKIGIEEAQNGYEAKNRVKFWIEPSEDDVKPVAKPSVKSEEEPDDLPF